MARQRKPKVIFTLSQIVILPAGEGKAKGFTIDQDEYHFTSEIGSVVFSAAPKAWTYHIAITGTVTRRQANEVLDVWMETFMDDVNNKEKEIKEVKIGFEVLI